MESEILDKRYNVKQLRPPGNIRTSLCLYYSMKVAKFTSTLLLRLLLFACLRSLCSAQRFFQQQQQQQQQRFFHQQQQHHHQQHQHQQHQQQQEQQRRQEAAAAALRDEPADVLGTLPGDSRDYIAHRYKELSKMWHPDKCASFNTCSGERKRVFEQQMARINNAYTDALKSTKKRRRRGGSGAGAEEGWLDTLLSLPSAFMSSLMGVDGDLLGGSSVTWQWLSAKLETGWIRRGQWLRPQVSDIWERPVVALAYGVLALAALRWVGATLLALLVAIVWGAQAWAAHTRQPALALVPSVSGLVCTCGAVVWAGKWVGTSLAGHTAAKGPSVPAPAAQAAPPVSDEDTLQRLFPQLSAEDAGNYLSSYGDVLAAIDAVLSSTGSSSSERREEKRMEAKSLLRQRRTGRFM